MGCYPPSASQCRFQRSTVPVDIAASTSLVVLFTTRLYKLPLGFGFYT